MIVDASLQFPTVVFTIGLGIVLFYWLFVLLGALDIDLLGGGDVDVSGAAKGVGDLVTGGAKGGGEALKGGGGHDVDADADGDGGGLLDTLGLGVVPLTISVSIIMLVCWSGSLLLMHHLGPRLGSWFGPVVLPGILIVSFPLTGLLVRPLAPVFRLSEGKGNKDYIGHTCTITTGKVDEQFGQAAVHDGGTVLEIPVRCDRSDVLVRGAKALIIDFDPERHAYVVEPSADMLAGPESEADRAS